MNLKTITSLSLGQWVMALLMVMTLVGVLTYIRIAFFQADIKLAVRLVEEVRVEGKPLLGYLNAAIPAEQRFCSAEEMSKFYGHMQVTCVHVDDASKKLVWSVNVFDGMVKPENQAAVDLGKGISLW